MRCLSIRFKITFWFTAALILVVLFTYVAVFFVSDQILQKTIRDNLIETVEDNVDEVEFYQSIANVDLNADVDHFIEYGDGYLEIDDDFLDAVNQVYTALYHEEGALLYGENPISRDMASIGFVDGHIQHIHVADRKYYIFDRQLTEEGLEGLWLRGVASEEQGVVQNSTLIQISIIFLPLLVLLASVGGYWIAARALGPIQEISRTADQIGRENDLKKRIDLGGGQDELHQLADSFNDMFEKLDKAFETERQFTSDASHELRTPMSVIMAQCEYTLEEPRPAKEYEEALRVIQRQSRKMSGLINDMLDFARLDTHSDRYGKVNIDMTELVTSVCTDMALIREKEISLQFEVEKGVGFYGNRELFSRLLANLISNAYRYGRENGHIWVRLWTGEKELHLSVADDGIGINGEEQQKIFRRFYQADNSRSGVGLGLGLSMAYEIARFHGGDISVESVPGNGSIFTFTATFL
ncbi:MAG: HAMP domain-containing histidine kinase [Lachnospiraceae bacterium]|nr:HAMP domain-containing histidine kinase [Lachnospiraceae bacterium]